MNKRKSRGKRSGRVPSIFKSQDKARRGKTQDDDFFNKLSDRFVSERINRIIDKIIQGHEFDSDQQLREFINEKIVGKKFEELQKLTDWVPSDRAQDLAFLAMETEEPEESLRLAEEALQLDPECLDALVVKISLTTYSPIEMAKRVKEVIARTEQKFGQEYFDENKGHFWGLVETRPYMRALAFLVSVLRMGGEIDEAICQAEKMLELNPDDNQGIRSTLLGMYLETGNLVAARRLIKEYPDDYLAVFLWGRILERYLSGDLKEAKEAFKRAEARNPYVFDYLTGKKEPERKVVDYYSPGDEREAILCLYEIGPAWKKHPEAIEWLKSLQKT